MAQAHKEKFYKMEKKNGYSFNASIPTFSLDSPHETGIIN